MNQVRFPTMDFAADIEESIEAIRANVPADGAPYYGLFSGGKDSVALKEVARMAGVPVEWHYNVTTIDPPELVHFIRDQHPDVKWVRSPHGPFFVRAAEVMGFPTRRVRWCCKEYKESQSPHGATLLMGIRSQESARRAKRWGLTTRNRRCGGLIVNPLIHWDVTDLWDFIRGNSVPCSELYNEGFHRLGCVGCPMARAAGRRKEFDRWPRYEGKWRKVFWRTWDRRAGTVQRDGRTWFGERYFRDWYEMWDWWMSDRSLPAKRVL
jgi:phosphoadenosine phosphosulfate reductase